MYRTLIVALLGATLALPATRVRAQDVGPINGPINAPLDNRTSASGRGDNRVDCDRTSGNLSCENRFTAAEPGFAPGVTPCGTRWFGYAASPGTTYRGYDGTYFAC